MKKLLVHLNAGHGIDTPGKRSPIWTDGSQLFEWQFNRKIVCLIQDRLVHNDIELHEVVPESEDISHSARIKRCKELQDKYSTYTPLTLDIHGNAFNMPQAAGFEVWTTKGETISDKVADFYIENLESYMKIPKYRQLIHKVRKDISDGDGDKEKNWIVMKGVPGAAILTENGFYTNYNQCQWMLSTEGQQFIADIHIRTIINYFNYINYER